jgi:alpha-glucosidase
MNRLNDPRWPLGPIALGFFLLAGALLPVHAQQHTLSSPNGQLQVTVETSPDLRWHLHYRNQPLLLPTEIGLELERTGALGRNVKVVRTAQSTINRVERPAVAQKSAEIPERYNELTVFCQGEWGVVFRAFDEGVAYRFFTRFNGRSTVLDERFSLQPAGCKTVFFPEEENFYSHNERLYKTLAPSEIPSGRLASLPVLLQYNNGVHLLLTETDLQDYPGLWVRGTASPGGLTGDFPHRAQYTVEISDRDREPIDRDRAMAVTDGLRTYPWRLFLVAGRPADLLVNQMPWLLAEPSRLKETAWIRPGKVAWDWWNNLNISGVDFRAGVNTATYRHFVDFAAENGLEYIILDEGWSEPANLLKINPDLDMDALADYARQKKWG